MEKSILEKNNFEATMMVGFGVNPDKLSSVAHELKTLGISFDKFIKFINKHHASGSFFEWEYIDLKLALNNYILAKVQYIVTKKLSYFEINPLYLQYNDQKETTEFCGVKEAFDLFKKHKYFKNRFIKRLKRYLLN